MQRKVSKALLLASICVGVGGCDQIPGTEDYKVRLAQHAAADALIDPTSALFRKMKVNGLGDTVCGEVNGKNRMGAYVGFTRFYASHVLGSYEVRLEPEFDSDYLASLEQSCRQINRAVGQSRAYGFDPGDVGSSICNEADEYRELRSQQVDWYEGWEELCWYDGTLPEDVKRRRERIEQATTAADAALAAEME